MRTRDFVVIEDNAGGLHLFVLEQDMVTYSATSNENNPGQLRDMLYALLNGSCPLAEGWDTQDDDGQAVYDDMTSYDYGWELVVIGEYDTDTQNGNIEYRRDRMGYAAQNALPEGWEKEYPPLS